MPNQLVKQITVPMDVNDAVQDVSFDICDGDARQQITEMKQSFQDGVDTIYNAFVAQNVTPTASTPQAIATAVGTLAEKTHDEIGYTVIRKSGVTGLQTDGSIFNAQYVKNITVDLPVIITGAAGTAGGSVRTFSNLTNAMNTQNIIRTINLNINSPTTITLNNNELCVEVVGYVRAASNAARVYIPYHKTVSNIAQR